MVVVQDGFGSLMEAEVIDVVTSNDVYHIGVLEQVVERFDYYANDGHHLFGCVVSDYLRKRLLPFYLENIMFNNL